MSFALVMTLLSLLLSFALRCHLLPQDASWVHWTIPEPRKGSAEAEAAAATSGDGDADGDAGGWAVAPADVGRVPTVGTLRLLWRRLGACASLERFRAWPLLPCALPLSQHDANGDAAGAALSEPTQQPPGTWVGIHPSADTHAAGKAPQQRRPPPWALLPGATAVLQAPSRAAAIVAAGSWPPAAGAAIIGAGVALLHPAFRLPAALSAGFVFDATGPGLLDAVARAASPFSGPAAGSPGASSGGRDLAALAEALALRFADAPPAYRRALGHWLLRPETVEQIAAAAAAAAAGHSRWGGGGGSGVEFDRAAVLRALPVFEAFEGVRPREPPPADAGAAAAASATAAAAEEKTAEEGVTPALVGGDAESTLADGAVASAVVPGREEDDEAAAADSAPKPPPAPPVEYEPVTRFVQLCSPPPPPPPGPGSGPPGTGPLSPGGGGSSSGGPWLLAPPALPHALLTRSCVLLPDPLLPAAAAAQHLRAVAALLGLRSLARAAFLRAHSLTAALAASPARVPPLAIAGAMLWVLRELPALTQEDRGFPETLSQAEFVPTGRGRLHAPSALYDPSVSELASILDPAESFPSAPYDSPELIGPLIALGLKRSVTQETVLEAASSIAAQGHAEPAAARARGRALLRYLEVDPGRMVSPQEQPGNPGNFFQAIASNLFRDDRAKRLEHERFLQARGFGGVVVPCPNTGSAELPSFFGAVSSEQPH